MGFLNLFSKKPSAPGLVRLPTGSFTIDAEGKVVTSTLPQSFPPEYARTLGRQVLKAFRSGQQLDLPLQEISITFTALKITARELRGGAIVFLAPRIHNP